MITLVIVFVSMLLAPAAPQRASAESGAPKLLWDRTFTNTWLIRLREINPRFVALSRRPIHPTRPKSGAAPGSFEEILVLDRRTGALVWRFNCEAAYTAADRDNLYLLPYRVPLRALEWETGKEQWQATVPHKFGWDLVWTLQDYPGRVFYWSPAKDTGPGTVLCLDSATGKTRWQAEQGRYYAGAAQGSLLFLDYKDHNLVLYRISAETGKASPGDPIPMPYLSPGDPEGTGARYVPRSHLYVVQQAEAGTGYDHYSVCVMDAAFKTLWSSGGYIRGIVGDAVAFSNHAVEDNITSLEARSLQTGKRLWQRRVAGRKWQSPPTWLAGVWQNVFLVVARKRLEGWRASDGKTLWSLRMRGEIWHVHTYDRRLWIVLKEGKDVWHIRAYDR